MLPGESDWQMQISKFKIAVQPGNRGPPTLGWGGVAAPNKGIQLLWFLLISWERGALYWSVVVKISWYTYVPTAM